MPEKIKYAAIGAGGMGRRHLRGYTRLLTSRGLVQPGADRDLRPERRERELHGRRGARVHRGAPHKSSPTLPR